MAHFMNTAVQAARANLVEVLRNPTKSTFAQKIRVSNAIGSLTAAHRDALYAEPIPDFTSVWPDVRQAAEDEINERVKAIMEAELTAARAELEEH